MKSSSIEKYTKPDDDLAAPDDTVDSDVVVRTDVVAACTILVELATTVVVGQSSTRLSIKSKPVAIDDDNSKPGDLVDPDDPVIIADVIDVVTGSTMFVELVANVAIPNSE